VYFFFLTVNRNYSLEKAVWDSPEVADRYATSFIPHLLKSFFIAEDEEELLG
jgi:hypothetical protein